MGQSNTKMICRAYKERNSFLTELHRESNMIMISHVQDVPKGIKRI